MIMRRICCGHPNTYPIFLSSFYSSIYHHSIRSNNPLGIKRNPIKTSFHPYFTLKDLLDPNILGDPENFNPANPLNSPPHIQPE
ncbi:cytochrome b [Armadillidium vulgare]|nr:cytochrome b [Armadillidium vulgare]